MEAIQQLAKPLKKSQVDAASRFWLEGNWESKEFAQLRQAFPNPDDAISIKAIVINALYGTNIFAITKVADCVERVLRRNCSTGSDLVEELVSEIRVITKQGNYSFAAKYAHFFVDSNLPILDWYAEWMVGKHLGQMRSKNPKRYHKFTEDIETLKRVAGLNCSCEDLDSYLWVAGEYWYWKEYPKVQVNTGLKLQFENVLKNPGSEPVLAALLGLSEGRV